MSPSKKIHQFYFLQDLNKFPPPHLGRLKTRLPMRECLVGKMRALGWKNWREAVDTDGKGENSSHSPKADDAEDAGRKNQQMIGLVFPGGD